MSLRWVENEDLKPKTQDPKSLVTRNGYLDPRCVRNGKIFDVTRVFVFYSPHRPPPPPLNPHHKCRKLAALQSGSAVLDLKLPEICKNK